MATKLLEYTFNNTISDCIPQFIGLSSDGYTISDSVSDNITTRIINVNDGVSLPTRIWFADDSHPEGRSLLTLEYLNTSNINNMSMLFCYCNYLTSVNTIGWDISKVTDMTLMFFLTSNLQNLTLSNFDITNCTSFYRMFEKSGIVELNFIGNSTNSSVGKNMSKMFADCNRLTKLSISNIPNINNMSWMFSGCSKLESLNLIGLDTSNCTDFTGMFYGCSSLTSLDLSSFNTSKANSMQQMFIGCNKITSLDLSNFNTSKVTDMAHMFQNCSSLTSLDLSSFNTSNVTNMEKMFNYCSNLIALDLSNFNTSSVTKMNYMFADCINLQTLKLSNFNTREVQSMMYMFAACSSLTSLDLSSFNTNNVTNMAYMFQDCRNLKSLDISNFNTSNSSLSFAFKNCKLEQIGMIYSDSTTINKVAENLYATSNCDIYYLDANLSELNPVNNVTYVQYKENVLYLPPTLTLRSNGDIHDEYNPFTSQFTQRISEDGSILENPVIATVKSIVAYNDTVKYGYALPDKTTDLYHPEVESYEQVIDSTTLNGTENWTKVNQTTFTTPFTNAKSETSTEVFTMKDDVESINIVNDTLSLVFKETSYVATNNIAVNALKIWLQTNNVEFKYELKERIFTDMTLEEFDFDNAHFVKPQAYKGGVMTQSNKDDLIFAPITYQTKSNNRYELPLLDSNSDYTLHYEGSVSEVDLGGSTNSSVENNCLVQSGTANKVALFNDEVSNVMLIKNDVREQTIPYFRGLLSTQMPVLTASTFTPMYSFLKDDGGENFTKLYTEFYEVTKDTFTFKQSGHYQRIGITTDNFKKEGKQTLERNKEYQFKIEILENTLSIDMEIICNSKYTDGVKRIVGAGETPIYEFSKTITSEIPENDVHGSGEMILFYLPSGYNGEVSFKVTIGYGNINNIKTSILSTPKDLELHSIGDDCDVLDCKTGELHRYYGKLIIDGSEKFEWHGMNDGVYGFNLSQNEVNKKINNRINPHKPSTCNSLEYRGSTMYNKKGEGFAISDADHAIVQVQLSLDRLPKLSEDGLRQYLSENPLHLIVPLLNPIVETVDLGIEYKEGDKKYIVRTHDDVTHVNVSSEGLVPITEIGYITNEDNVETVTLEGEMVTLENAKANSVIQRAFMTGYTLLGNVATIDTLACYNGATISGETITLDRTRGSSLVQVTGANKIIKANTKYLCILHDVVGDMTGVHLRVQHETTVETVEFVNNKAIFTAITPSTANRWVFVEGAVLPSGGNTSFKWSIIEYQDGIENLNIPYFNDYGMRSAKMPVLKTKNKQTFVDFKEVSRGEGDFVVNSSSDGREVYITTPRWQSLNYVFDYEDGQSYTIKLDYETGNYVIDFYSVDGRRRYGIAGTGTIELDFIPQLTGGRLIEIVNNLHGGSLKLSNIELCPTSNKDEPFKSNILSCNEEVELCAVGDVKDELNLLTGEMTKRFGVAVMDGSDDEVYIDNWDPVSFVITVNNPIFDNIKRNSVNITFDKYVYEWVHGDNTGKSGFYWHGNNLWFRTPLENLGGSHTQQAFKTWLQSNPITVQYELATPTVETIDLTLTQQNVPSEKMTYFKDYYGQLVSDGTLPKFTYRLESTNTYNVSQLKPNTLYTMYSEGEATVATLGGKASILLNNPQTLTSGTQNKSLTFDSPTSKVVLIEKDVTNQVVPYFTGTLDTVNPIIKTTSGNKSNTVSTNVYLRSVGDVCDTYDLNTGTLVKRVGEDHRVLDHPETSNIPVNTPLAYHGATVEMSSNELSLLPRFEYSCKSPNYYPLPVESNEVYTLKFDKTSNGTLTMGGVTANTTGNQTITTKNSDVQGVLFSEDLGIGNLMVMKTDVRNVPTPYFRGIQSVVNPTITVSNGDTQSNSVSLTLTMRSLPNGVKDELNLVTGEYIQRLDQRNFAEGDVNGRDMITDGTTTIYPLTVPRRSTLELNWSDGVLTAYDGTTNITSEAELLKPHLFFQLATSTLEEIISQLKDENASLLETVATLEEDNLSTMVAVTEVFETVLVMMPMTLSVNNDTKGGGSYMVEVYVTLILKGKKTLEQVPAVIRPQVEQMLKDVDAL